MNVYLALANGGGGYVFKDATKEQLMNVYLTTPHAYSQVFDMNIYLAGHYAEENRVHSDKTIYNQKIFILESFYYIKDWMIPYIKDHWNFLLDSGAFTFMNAKKKNNIDWDSYLEKYAKFINDHDIKLFFELDIDSIVGLKEVERLRTKLETLTNKKCIPVWHKSRGLEYWKQMVKDYDYVSIGGIVTKEIKPEHYSIFNNLLKIAKENDCKVHGLGFTQTKILNQYPFYSVDSTAWIYGNRGGFLYKYANGDFTKIQVPKGKRLKGKEVAIHNFKEWIKFQKYAKDNL